MEETRDDAVLPAMRIVALVVVAVLLPALVILWGLPGKTADLWAWTIKPDLTPIFCHPRHPFLGGRTPDVLWRYPWAAGMDLRFPNPMPHPLG